MNPGQNLDARLVMNLLNLGLSSETIASLGGRLPQQTLAQYGDLASLPSSEVEQLQQAAGSQPLYEHQLQTLVAAAKALGVAPTEVAEYFLAFAEQKNVSVAQVATARYQSAAAIESNHRWGNSVTFDVERWFQAQFAGQGAQVAR
jgi:hypothetical protein